ncbi:Mor transcription activator family protein [uncultured Desulfosarcina sp.]|uniref:Mor transcription activator family protein n=1 Tax=uncultured Desulfosarcina sp. TaxID=218289 RepID=UPI0029C6A23A|nr:Mor transcription activator family protein [uncultured Desulfosarcina sp.]
MKYDVKIEDLPPECKELADIIGLQSVLDLANYRGGESLYIPKSDKLTRAARDRQIRDEFNGTNHKELARRHNLSIVWIRNIVHPS